MINKIGSFLRFYTRLACGDNCGCDCGGVDGAAVLDLPCVRTPLFAATLTLLDTAAAQLPLVCGFSKDVASLLLLLFLGLFQL